MYVVCGTRLFIVCPAIASVVDAEAPLELESVQVQVSLDPYVRRERRSRGGITPYQCEREVDGLPGRGVEPGAPREARRAVVPAERREGAAA